MGRTMTDYSTFEVHVQQGGRWVIHATFQGHQKDAAIEEGRELDRLSTVDAVKVIKEIYDPEKDIHNEFIVYKSPSMKSSASTAVGAQAGSGNGSPVRESWISYDDEDDYGDARRSQSRHTPGRRKKGSTMTTIMVKLLLVILFSIGLAAALSALADELLGGTRLFGFHFVGNAQSNLLISVFITTFLISAIGMTVTIMRGETLEKSKRRKNLQRPVKQARVAKQQARRKPAPPTPQKTKQDIGQSAADGPSSQALEEAPGSSAETLTHLEDAMQGVEQFKIDQQQATEEKTAQDQAVNERLQAEINPEPQPAAQEPSGRGVVLDAGTNGMTPSPQVVETLTPAEEKQKVFMLNFLSRGLEGSQTDEKKLDNFNKFGVNLYLAGACEIISQKRDLDVRARSKILGDAVQVMGFKKSHAASFSDRYEEYLMADARYMQMFQSGRNAMNIYLTDENAAPRLLDSALEDWNKPKEKDESTGPVTVLFTDIAGSTAMTQALGDAGAQQAVRAHNRIVREALSRNAGKEVKHTGDGIMASFVKTSDGVDASIQMQKETALHNQQNPDLPLHLKIGLNAGEPIAEDNDLFGTVVQLSARIVDKAAADQIFVSEIVRGICAGKQYNFVNRGGFSMKGFGEEATLFEVIWNDPEAAGNPAG